MPRCLAAFLIALVSVAGPATARPAKVEGLELLEITQEENSLGWATFAGRVQNNGPMLVSYPKITVTLKMGGEIVEIDERFIEGPDGNQLAPGEVGVFELLTTVDVREFDSFSTWLDSRTDGVDLAFVTGEITLESFNVVEDFKGDALGLGEILNNTNAIFTRPEVQIAYYDADDNFIGAGESFWLVDEWHPGEVVPLRARSEVSFADAARWEVTHQAIPIRLVGGDVATAVQTLPWGAIKGRAPHGD